MILRGSYCDAAILLLNIVLQERRRPYFRAFFPQVVSLTRNVVLRKLGSLGSADPAELVLDAWERALDVGLGDQASRDILLKMARCYETLGDLSASRHCLDEAALLGWTKPRQAKKSDLPTRPAPPARLRQRSFS
jgi:hypothetical protein